MENLKKSYELWHVLVAFLVGVVIVGGFFLIQGGGGLMGRMGKLELKEEPTPAAREQAEAPAKEGKVPRPYTGQLGNGPYTGQLGNGEKAPRCDENLCNISTKIDSLHRYLENMLHPYTGQLGNRLNAIEDTLDIIENKLNML